MRAPDVEINGQYLHRWHLIPRNRWFNVYLHHFGEPDPGRDLHDHPWWNVSVVVSGWYEERLEDRRLVMRRAPCIVVRRATALHRIERISRNGCWTLFITGPRVRRWGFVTEEGWVSWQEYLDV